MRIHDTFTKKDIVNIIEDNHIEHINTKLTRYEIIKDLITWINENDLNSQFSFLENENENKKLTIKEKNDIITKAQQIISLHKNGYNYDYSCYDDYDDLIRECESLTKYGDISSVRRAIKFVNNKYDLDLQCYISDEINEKLEHREILKKNATPKITFVFKKCIVKFD